MAFEIIDSKTVYRGRVLDVRCDRVRTPEGSEVSLDVVVHHGAVTLIPIDEEGCIWFVRQYRHAAGKSLLELPAGAMEPGELPQVSAMREVREEIGMAAGTLENVGEFFLAPGYSTEYMFVFLATGLYSAPLPGDVDEDLSIEKIPVRQAYELALEGEIQDAKSLSALLLVRPHLERLAYG
jgi:ADP-ribose pyrophosphatase